MAHTTPSISASFRWAEPANGLFWWPLPSGNLLSLPYFVDQFDDNSLFFVAAHNTDGQLLWELPLNMPVSDVVEFDVSPRGDVAAVFDVAGTAHIISIDTGKVLTTEDLNVLGHDPEASQYMLVKEGEYIGVQHPADASSWTLTIWPALIGGFLGEDASGPVTHASPYHWLYVGVNQDDKGLDVFFPKARAYTIPLPESKLNSITEMSTTADGQAFYVRSDNGIDVFDRDPRLVFHIDSDDSLETNFAPLSGHFWNVLPSGQIDIYTASGEKSSLQIDLQQAKFWRVMPGGEGVFQVPSKKAECVVQPDGTVVGCFPFVMFKTAGSSGKTFFWVYEAGTISAYNGK